MAGDTERFSSDSVFSRKQAARSLAEQKQGGRSTGEVKEKASSSHSGKWILDGEGHVGGLLGTIKGPV